MKPYAEMTKEELVALRKDLKAKFLHGEAEAPEEFERFGNPFAREHKRIDGRDDI